MMLVRVNTSIAPSFFFQILKGEQFERLICLKVSGSSIPHLFQADMNKFEFLAPDIEEQTRLGNFFKQLDEVIKLLEKELKKYKDMKKAYLGKIFPREGAKVPELRFPGFSGEWEENRLEDIVTIVGGGTPSTEVNKFWNGQIDWYSPSEIGGKIYVGESSRKISQLGLRNSSANILPAWKTILFTSRASIGDMAILTKEASTNQGFQSFVIGNSNIYFLYSLGFKIKKFALENASGSTFLEISGKKLGKMFVLLPSEEEQTQIGNFFKQLDETIERQAQELEKYKDLKKAYLAKMFV